MVNIEFNGKTNEDFGLFISDIELRKKAKPRTKTITVEGRNGTLVDYLGSYEPYTRKVKLVNRRDSDISRVYEWLTGKGILRTSLDEGGFFYVDVLEGIERDYLGKSYHAKIHHTVPVTFLVQPFFYLDAGTRPLEITATKKLFNIGTYEAEPIITVYGTGTGTVYINDQVVTLSNLVAPLTIDCKLQEVFENNLPAGRKMQGDFPVLEMDSNTISFTGGITKLVITPRWCEL